MLQPLGGTPPAREYRPARGSQMWRNLRPQQALMNAYAYEVSYIATDNLNLFNTFLVFCKRSLLPQRTVNKDPPTINN